MIVCKYFKIPYIDLDLETGQSVSRNFASLIRPRIPNFINKPIIVIELLCSENMPFLTLTHSLTHSHIKNLEYLLPLILEY